MLTTLLVASALLSVGDEPAPKGHLVIVGGSVIPADLRQKMLDLSGGPKAHIVIIPNASSVPEATGAEAVDRFRQAGATDIEIADLTKPEPAVSAILKASLIWIAGGNQNRLTELMIGTPIPEAIRRRYTEGATIGGTSAGAAVMTGLMLTGVADLDTIRNGSTQLVGGLGLWNEAIVDQHFLKRGRFNRLASAVLDHPEMLGIGIDESTAIVVSGGRQFEVAGMSNVIVVDARKTTRDIDEKPRSGEPAFGVNLSLHVLKAGMKYDLDKGVLPSGGEPVALGGGQ